MVRLDHFHSHSSKIIIELHHMYIVSIALILFIASILLLLETVTAFGSVEYIIFFLKRMYLLIVCSEVVLLILCSPLNDDIFGVYLTVRYGLFSSFTPNLLHQQHRSQSIR